MNQTAALKISGTNSVFDPDIPADIGPKMGAEVAKPTRASP